MFVPHQFYYHALMLRDEHRIECYKSAIKDIVTRDLHCVDVGCGTGILAFFLSKAVNKRVAAIEYFSSTAKAAAKVLKDSACKNVDVINASSFNVKLRFEPDILVTETIGPIGPEENIVESCFDFKNRHKSIKTLIPSQLSICAEKISLREANEKQSFLSDSFRRHSTTGLKFDSIVPLIEEENCKKIHQTTFTKAIISSQEKIVLTSYKLGIDRSPEFYSNIDFNASDTYNAVHLYFEAILSPGIILSSNFRSPLTHWLHSYIIRPKNKSQLAITYKAKNRTFNLFWS